MAFKLFMSTALCLFCGWLAGIFSWADPMVSNFHQAMGGGPVLDPRGQLVSQLEAWLGFLPADGSARFVFAGWILAMLIALKTLLTVIAGRIRRTRQGRLAATQAEARTLQLLRARERSTANWVARPIFNEYMRDDGA